MEEGQESQGTEADSVDEHEAEVLLRLKPSVYEAVLLAPLFSSSYFTIARVWILLGLNFILQFGVVCILYTQITADSEKGPERDFFDGKVESGPCSWARPNDLSPKYGFPNETALVCIMDEILLTRDFQTLDLDGDGHWTDAEAAELERMHLANTGRTAKLQEVYVSLLRLLKAHATHDATVPCEVGDTVHGYVPEYGWVSRNLSIIGQDVSQDFGIIVQDFYFDTKISNFYRVRDASLLFKPGDHETVCRMASCMDTDYGRLTQTTGGPCTYYLYESMDPVDYHLTWKGYYDRGHNYDTGDDFWNGRVANRPKAAELCCLVGGGTYSYNRTKFDKYVIDLSVQDLLQVQKFFECEASGDEAHCIKRFTHVPRDFYTKEIQPVLDMCMVGDKHLCGNILSRGGWPEYFPNGHMNDYIWQALENITQPLLLKVTGISEVRQLTALDVCEAALEKFCPSLFQDTPQWNSRRLNSCGHRESASVAGDQYALSEYEKSKVFNAAQGMRTAVFKAFLGLLICLWAFANIEEVRDVIVWWLVLYGLPTATAADDCITRAYKDQPNSLNSITLRFRLCLIFLNLLPRTILALAIFNVGVCYLFIVRDMTDLVLNSLALTFLVTVDDILFMAFVDKYIHDIVDNFDLLGRTRHASNVLSRLIRRTKMSSGLLLLLPLLAIVVVQIRMHFVWVAQVGDMLSCLCEASGETCFTSAAAQTTSEHVFGRRH